MIISASRRCDIPAFAGDWFMEGLRRGEVLVENPFRAGQTRRVSLMKEAVDAFVFWSRDPRPFLRHLPEIERGGFPYYFLITATGYPRSLEPAVPPAADAARFFRELAERIGRRRVVWRYDPVLITPELDCRFHAGNFFRLAGMLAPYASRAIVSFFDPYPKVVRRLRKAAIDAAAASGSPEQRAQLLASFAAAASGAGLEIQSCAEPAGVPPGANARPLVGPGANARPPVGPGVNARPPVGPGKCIDERLLNELFGLKLSYRKDPSQRPACLCQRSVDIGRYGTCRHGCIYCYAR